jgi:hypothetical protein
VNKILVNQEISKERDKKSRMQMGLLEITKPKVNEKWGQAVL